MPGVKRTCGHAAPRLLPSLLDLLMPLVVSSQVPEEKRVELYQGHQAYLADKAARDAEKEKRREAEKAERAAKRKKSGDESEEETGGERHKVLRSALIAFFAGFCHIQPVGVTALSLCICTHCPSS